MSVLGLLAVAASLTIVLLGLPAQLLRNYRRKSTEGIDTKLVFSMMASYTTWTLYGLEKGDPYILAGSALGCLLSLVFVVQFFRYRKKKGGPPCKN